MKRILLASLIVAVLSFMSVPIAFGYAIYEDDLIKLTRGTGNGPGGEFIVSKVSPPPQANMFSTFCLEKNEFITMGNTYRVGSIDTFAIAGGYGGGSPDPLDSRTAYLYYHFAMGDLAGYVYGNNASADALQAAIWFIEDEGGANNAFVALAQAAINSGEWSGLGNVRVLNLVEDVVGAAPKNKQSVLTLVPEPLTILLLGIGLVGLSGLRRKE